jgi:hypothetical protein
MYLLKLQLLVRVSRYLLIKGRNVYKGVVSSLSTLYFRLVEHFVHFVTDQNDPNQIVVIVRG